MWSVLNFSINDSVREIMRFIVDATIDVRKVELQSTNTADVINSSQPISTTTTCQCISGHCMDRYDYIYTEITEYSYILKFCHFSTHFVHDFGACHCGASVHNKNFELVFQKNRRFQSFQKKSWNGYLHCMVRIGHLAHKFRKDTFTWELKAYRIDFVLKRAVVKRSDRQAGRILKMRSSKPKNFGVPVF